MSLQMRIDDVTLLTSERPYYFDFRAPCTVIDGPVGTGKSSLLELIKHVLGGNAILTPAIRDNVDRVRATVRLNSQTLVLSRGFGREATSVSVSRPDEGTIEQQYSVRGGADGRETISDALLAALDIPNVRIQRSRSNSTSASMALTFNDIFSYLYVEQQNIDRSIAHHTEAFREPKRRAVFELLMGLATQEQLEAETRLGVIKDELKDAQARADTVGGFLEAAEIGSEAELALLEAQYMADARTAETSLDRLRVEVSGLTRAHEDLTARVRKSELAAREATEDLERSRIQLANREQLLAQLRLETNRRSKQELASLQLGPLDFVICPRCMQDIDENRASANQCTVCLQPVDSTPTLEETGDNFDPSEQELELESLIASSRDHVESLTRRSTAETARLRALRSELDEVTSDAVSPRFQEIEVLSSQRARASADADSVRRSLALRRDHTRLLEQIASLRDERTRLEEVVEAARARHYDRNAALDELDEIFDETVRALETPHAQSAALHRTNYLPLVDGEPFNTIAVAGGLKTVVTVAYHLTLLSYSLNRPEVLLPSLLILDTPKKNIGQNDEDSRLGERVYDRIRTIVQSQPGSSQIIIADNDPPADRNWSARIELSYDSPLLSDIGHPGEEAAASGQLETVGHEG